jgi:hypothetical protein
VLAHECICHLYYKRRYPSCPIELHRGGMPLPSTQNQEKLPINTTALMGVLGRLIRSIAMGMGYIGLQMFGVVKGQQR